MSLLVDNKIDNFWDCKQYNVMIKSLSSGVLSLTGYIILHTSVYYLQNVKNNIV